MQPFKTFLLLSWQDKAAFTRAWLTLAAAKLGVRFLGMARTLALLTSPLRERSASEASRVRVWPRPALWLPVAARYVPGGTKCLPRSVALLALLRRAGIDCDLRIGIGKTDPALEAHAWVEVDGVPVNDTDDVATRYSTFEAGIATS